MKRREYRKRCIKFQLEERRGRRIKAVVWKLDREQQDIIKELGYKTEPFIYEVSTRPFHNIRRIKSSLVKDIHYACKRGKRVLYLKPKKGDLQVLEEFGIRYKPYKYQIQLV